jgi:hypothetical protein
VAQHSREPGVEHGTPTLFITLKHTHVATTDRQCHHHPLVSRTLPEQLCVRPIVDSVGRPQVSRALPTHIVPKSKPATTIERAVNGIATDVGIAAAIALERVEECDADLTIPKRADSHPR